MGVAFVISGIQLNVLALTILGGFEILVGLIGVYAGAKELKNNTIKKQKTCPNCGTPYDDETHICPGCGLQL